VRKKTERGKKYRRKIESPTNLKKLSSEKSYLLKQMCKASKSKAQGTKALRGKKVSRKDK